MLYMTVNTRFCRSGILLLALTTVFVTGCATRPRIDWNSRTGLYTYEQAILELGPPDKNAKLTDGTIVAEWLTRRGYTYAYTSPAYGFYPWDYGPFYPTYVDTYSYPDSFLRLVFGSDGVLREFKKFYR